MKRPCGVLILQLIKTAGSEECLHYHHHRENILYWKMLVVMSHVDYMQTNVNSVSSRAKQGQHVTNLLLGQLFIN